MPATTPAITGIVNALDTRLDAITAGATYNTTPTVTQYRAAPFQSTALPAINIRVLGEPQPTDGLMGKWDHRPRVALDIAATTAAEYEKVLVDILVALDTGLTLGGLIFDLDYLGNEVQFDQEDKSFIGGTALLELAYRTDDMKI